MKKTFFTIAAFLLLRTSMVQAGYTIQRVDGGQNNLVAGRYYTYRVTNTDVPLKLQDVYIKLSDTNNSDISVAPGVQTGSSPFPRYALDSLGQLDFQLRFYVAGNFSLTVDNSQPIGDTGSINPIRVEDYPTHFGISPANPTAIANQPFQITITAYDRNNQIVQYLEDEIQIQDSQLGSVTLPSAQGLSFVNGQVVNASVTVQAANMNNQFTLTTKLAGSLQYYDPIHYGPPSLAPQASSVSQLINLTPGAFSKLIMLFPGETLTPGIGKDSSGILPQVAGTPVSTVLVRRVDQWFNPLLDNPNPVLPVNFTSSNMPTDGGYFPFTQNMTGSLLTISAAQNLINFGGSGGRDVKATPVISGNLDPSKEDTSHVIVDPGVANSYDLTILNPQASYTTADIIQVRIRAFDQFSQALTTLFGPVPGAELQAVFGAGSGNRNWIDTDDTTLVPDNVVSFSAGVADVNLVVTKAGLLAKIRYAVPTKPNLDSPTFTMNEAGPYRILFSIIGTPSFPNLGEVFTPGTFPGNSGTPPVITAGQQVLVEAYVTDRRWNVTGIPGGATLQLVNDLPNVYISASHPAGQIVPIPAGGQMKYDANPAFNQAFTVTCFTAGPNNLVPAPYIKGLTTNAPTAGGSTFYSSTMTVLPGTYAKMVLQADGETIRPGTNLYSNGKNGTPITTLQAGNAIQVTAFATDQYFNPIITGPFPTVDFTITPNLASQFFNSPLPSTMFGGQKIFNVTLSTASIIEVFDTNDLTKNATTYISVVSPGQPDHFRLTPTIGGTKQAGVPFQVTIQVEDQYNNLIPDYNNPISLLATSGATTMSPETLSLVNGSSQTNITLYTAGPAIQIQMSRGSISKLSSPFNVTSNVSGYRRLVLLFPGESLSPGLNFGTTGKTGSPTPTVVGFDNIIRVVTCDNFYNPVFSTGSILLSSDHYITSLGGLSGGIINSPYGSYSEFDTTLEILTATTTNVYAQDLNFDALISRSTSTIVAAPGTYKKIQILVPDQQADPGSTLGYKNTISTQSAGIPFLVTINAVDDFWNVVPYNGGDVELSGTYPNLVQFTPLNSADQPQHTLQKFVNGSSVRNVVANELTGTDTYMQLTAHDNVNGTKPNAVSNLFLVTSGPSYLIQMASEAVAGHPFSSTITLQQNGITISTFTGTIYLSAVFSTTETASGNFTPNGPRAITMTNGLAVVNDLTYAYVENIKIKVTDNINRVGYSGDVNVKASGLEYEIDTPLEATVGPPNSFDVTIRLVEKVQRTLVKNSTHTVNITSSGAGTLGVPSAQFNQGLVQIQQSYTKAEKIALTVSEALVNGDPNFSNIPSKPSNPINIKPDHYQKILIFLPGQVWVPGVTSTDGKDSSGLLSQRLGVPFDVQVRAVDQYWNEDNTFSGGSIKFIANDFPPSLSTSNPTNQGASFVNGEMTARMTLNNQGPITITASDQLNASIAGQSQDVQVGGNSYAITFPSFECDGTPDAFCSAAQFTMNITVIDSSGIPVIGINQGITLEAFRADGTTTTPSGALSVTQAQIVNGAVSIPNQSYNYSEPIIIKVSEVTNSTSKRTAETETINFIPRRISYRIDTSTLAKVNTPFSISIRAYDVDTGKDWIYLNNRKNDLAAYTGTNPGTGVLTPSGVNAANFSNGVSTLSLTYTKSEVIFIRMTDKFSPVQATGPNNGNGIFDSAFITINPSSLADIDLVDFTMQSNEKKTVPIKAFDSFTNLIPNKTLTLTFDQSNITGSILMNGKPSPLSAKTNSLGILDVQFEPTADADGVYRLIVTDGDEQNGFSKSIAITVLGFPKENLTQNLINLRIPINSDLHLTDVDRFIVSGATVSTVYNIDNMGWYPYNRSAGIQSIDPTRGFPVFDQTRTYQIQFYSILTYSNSATQVSELAMLGGVPHQLSVQVVVPAGKLSGYPNPFNPKDPTHPFIVLQYPLERPSGVTIDIYDLFGQSVWHKDIQPGEQGGKPDNSNNYAEFEWQGVNDRGNVIGNGGYIVVVKIGETGQIMKSKIMVVK